MKRKSLMRKSLTQFIVCVALLLLSAAPLFYLLTKNFYAEDMIDIVEAVEQGKPVPSIDLEEDIIHGVVLQFVLIMIVLGIAIVLMMRFISQRLWRPFDKTLRAIETFKLESGAIPVLPESDVKEFARLNAVLRGLMKENIDSYRAQKEFTENASHELQTPLAVFQSKLDILLQQPDISEKQADVIQELYRINGRLSRLNRNLLLLAKMENRQFCLTENVDVIVIIKELMPYLESIAEGINIVEDFRVDALQVEANRSLLESLVSNLVVNAVRHNKPCGKILLTIDSNSLIVSNTSEEKALDREHIFNRFYRTGKKETGNGLGLAIVKAVCDYHDWHISYDYSDGFHVFTVRFS